MLMFAVNVKDGKEAGDAMTFCSIIWPEVHTMDEMGGKCRCISIVTFFVVAGADDATVCGDSLWLVERLWKFYSLALE